MTKSKQRIRELTAAGLAAALLCAASPFSINIGPIPLSFATLIIYMSAAYLGSLRASAAVGVYLILGLAGLPVFSGFTAGAAKLVGPTGGYLVGYIPLALIVGLASKWKPSFFINVLFMIAGTAVLYTFGTAWYCVQSGVPVGTAMSACVLPFLPGDAIKIVAAATVSVKLRKIRQM